MFEILKLGDKEPIVYYVPNGGGGGWGFFCKSSNEESDLVICDVVLPSRAVYALFGEMKQ